METFTPLVLSKIKLLESGEFLKNEMAKSLKTTNPDSKDMAQVKGIKVKISKGLTCDVDPGTDDSRTKFSSIKPPDRPENNVSRLQNDQNMTQDQAKLARARSPPKANFA